MARPAQVVVTRPAREAAGWVDALRARDFHAVALPLMDIAPALDPQRLAAAWQMLPDCHAAMFVSANAVTHFFASDSLGSRRWPAQTRAWAPGPGTARALRAAGVPPSRLDTPGADAPQFDSEALWAVAGAAVHPGDTVLVVRGSDAGRADDDGAGHGRAWLTERLNACGARVETLSVYRRGPPAWTPDETQAATALARASTAWIFSNSEAIGHLVRLLPAGTALREGTAVATHPRIADAAHAAGFGRVLHSRPTVDAVADTLSAL